MPTILELGAVYRVKSRRWISLLAIGALCACQREQPAQVSQPAAFDARLSFGVKPFVIGLGGSMRLTMKVIDAAGDTIAAPASVLIVSRSPAVVSVDSGTKLTANGQGSAWIIASVDTAGRTLIDSMSVDVDCTAELVPIFTPPVQTLAVGESFTPSLKFSTCGGHIIITDTLRWTANDATIVRVDSLSGTSTGLRVGQTYLHAQSVRFGQINGLGITVHAP